MRPFKKKTYVYFVSFSCWNIKGWMEYFVDNKIVYWYQIEEISNIIKEKNKEVDFKWNIIIENFILLRVE